MALMPRVIPVLLVSDGYLVKPVAFRKPVYIGDPINAVKIFNEKEVDELVVLDIDATRTGRGANFDLIESIASEAFMPVGYGGGVRDAAEAERIIGAGMEKVVLGTAMLTRPEAVTEISQRIGAQGTVVSVDAKKRFAGGYEAMVTGGGTRTRETPVEWARRAESLGAGEVILTSIDREGSRSGYDLALVRQVTDAVSIPVVALGGAGSPQHLAEALGAGASAAGAGTMFVQHGKHKAVLITYPSPAELGSLAGVDVTAKETAS